MRKLSLFLALFLSLIGIGQVWAQKSLPYSYDFENNDLAGEGWTLNNSGTSAIASVSNTANSGSYYFRFFYNSNPPQYLISPVLESSSTGLTVSFYQRGQSDSYPISYNVGYSTTGNDPTDFTWSDEITYSTGTYKLQELSFPVSGIKYIAFRFNTSADSWGYFMYLDDITISSYNPYKTPTDFTLSSFTSTSATFSWTAGNQETNWKFAYSTNPNFTPSTETATSIIENPYTLSGLTEGTTYYACIRADYGNGNYSDWTDKIEFTPRDTKEITIYDGTNENLMAPLNGNRVNSITHTQLIIPSSQLEDIQGRQIIKLTFYAKEETVTWGSATFEVYIKPTTSNAFPTSNYDLDSWGTNVYKKASLSVSNHKMEIELNTPFNYTSGNLLIGIKQIEAGTNATVSWYGDGTYTAGIGLNKSGNNATRISYPRKITITTTASTTAPVQMGDNGYTTFASTYPLDLTTANLPSGLKAYKAAVNVQNSNVLFTEINQTVSANTGMLLEGTANQTYYIPVASSGTTPDNNDFLVNAAQSVVTSDTNYNIFVLQKGSSDPLTFIKYTGNAAIPADKAYLQVDANLARLNVVFDEGEATGIENVNHEIITNNRYYDLQGRRVENPTRGLYILNGKKVIIK